MTKTERQFAVWRLLASSAAGLRLKELADRLGVSKNTVQRDVDELSRAGVQVLEQPDGQALRFSIRAAAAAPPQLSPGSLDALAAGLAALAPFEHTDVGRDFAAVVAALAPGLKAGPFTGAQQRGRRSGAPSVFATLLGASRTSRLVRINYAKRGAKHPRAYVLEPHELLLHEGLVYLRACKPGERIVRHFALIRVSKVCVLAQQFKRRKLPRTGFGVWEGRPEAVEVRFHTEISPFIHERRWHPTQKLRAEADGTLVFTAKLSGMHEFVGWVMSWGGRAELVAPTAWRDEVLRRSLEMTDRHWPAVTGTEQ